VVDAEGAPLSNSPPVELSIVSGPGEFPTGPFIKFENKSDIRIQDGQASIAIRAWQAGTTVVKASSPGLKDAELSLRFIGGAPYVEENSPKGRPRPYVRFNKKNQLKAESTFGTNNPIFASTSAAGSSPGLAADANLDTAWKADPADPNPSITLDTEKELAISKIQLVFPPAQESLYRVQVSDDGTSWKPVAGPLPAGKGTVNLSMPQGTTGRHVRVSFENSGQGTLSEIRVLGTVLD
jgi:hypothetical protein